MEQYLRKYCRINQRHMDVSDYENFYTCARAYVAQNPEKHKELARILLQAIKSFKNTVLVGISYRLLDELSCDVEIDEDIVAKHFRSRGLRNYIYPLISRQRWTMFDRKLMRLLHDPGYESIAFFRLLRSRREWVVSFLEMESSILLRKQMMVMAHSRIFHNLGYFVRHFGSKDRSISFLCREVFVLFAAGLGSSSYECAAFRIPGGERTRIFLNSRLDVESEANFLINLVDLLPDRDDILESMGARDRDRVARLLSRYINVGDSFELPDDRWVRPVERRAVPEVLPICRDENFDYLFDGRSYKDIADCIEV
jgi:hypothetical protein